MAQLLFLACKPAGGGGSGSTVTTPTATALAGNFGGTGNMDGTGTAAYFNTVKGLARDSTGALFVADSRNHTIRKITVAGVVTTFAGTAGVSGSADGTGAAARFYAPTGLAIDSGDNLYVTEEFNYTIRKITPSGVVSTLAGLAGSSGSTDGTGAAARFNRPAGIAVDSAGTVYVADADNRTIRKITPAGAVTTFAGAVGVSGSTDGTVATVLFSFPTGVAVDVAGQLYVSDQGNHNIRKITSAGVVTTLAGPAGLPPGTGWGSADGTGATARFNIPSGITIDATGDLYVTDSSNSTIRKITSSGVVTTIAGMVGTSGSADGTGTAARFSSPLSITTDNAGHLYVAHSNVVRKVTTAGVTTTLAGSSGVAGSADGALAIASFSAPSGIAVDGAGNIYIADNGSSNIRKLSSSGIVSTLASAADGFDEPNGITVDSVGNIYVANSNENTVRKITPLGIVSDIGVGAMFSEVFDVAADSTGNVYVADTTNNTIRKITPAGVISTLAGTTGSSGSADGTGAAARFNRPQGIATDSAGNVYISDTQNKTIRKITVAGVVSTLAGTTGVAGSADGVGASATFGLTRGLAVDSTGNVYVADTSNHTIRKITPAGVVSTVVGVAGKAGYVAGAALPGYLNSPRGVAISNDKLYVTMSNGIAVISPLP